MIGAIAILVTLWLGGIVIGAMDPPNIPQSWDNFFGNLWDNFLYFLYPPDPQPIPRPATIFTGPLQVSYLSTSTATPHTTSYEPPIIDMGRVVEESEGVYLEREIVGFMKREETVGGLPVEVHTTMVEERRYVFIPLYSTAAPTRRGPIGLPDDFYPEEEQD